MSFHFTLFYPENLAPASVNEVLRQLLIPRKWRHFLRIEQNILVNGNYRYFNQNILPVIKLKLTWIMLKVINRLMHQAVRCPMLSMKMIIF